jgi:hypothetical protein
MNQLAIRRRGKGRPRTRPGAALGDKAYSSAANRTYLRKRGIKAVIAVKEDQKNHRRRRGRAGGRPPAFDAGHYKDRNTVRALLWQAQAVQSGRHPLRQARADLPGHHRRRHHQNLATRPRP